MLEIINGLSLRKRLYVMLACMLFGLLIFGVFSVYKLRTQILNEKKIAINALVDSAMGVIQHQYDLFKEGKISEEEAQKLAKDNLRKSRFNGGSDYFFIYDLNGNNIMHASKPEREGKNFLESKDPSGKPYLKEWVELLKRDDQAYISYLFPKAGSTKAIPKLSYAKVFKPWGWWLGTGVYIEDVDAEFNAAAIRMVIFLSIVGILLSVIGWAINRSVQRQIGGEPGLAAAQVAEFASGNLQVSIASNSDLQGNLLSALSAMQSKLAEIVRSIRNSTEQLDRECSEMADSANEISRATSSQAQSSETTAASIEELTVSINEVSEMAKNTEVNSRKTSDLANQGGEVVRQAAQEIGTIAMSVKDSTERIQLLVERSNEIGNITKVIKEIADQTNLLALNAAIEAARAGEQGRGFAVVADEVRKLAERTTLATNEISKMIDSIQDDTQQAVVVMENASPRVAKGEALANEAMEVLKDIEQQARNSLIRAEEVASAAREQASVANDIGRHIENIASMAEQTNATSQSNADAAFRLKTLSQKLIGDIGYFRL